MNKSFLSAENLALLGVLDEFYDLYKTIGNLYGAALEDMTAFPDDFSRYYNLDESKLHPKFKKLFNKFYSKFAYIFTDRISNLHIDTPSLHSFYYFNTPRRNLTRVVRPISFSEFLYVFERMTCLMLLHRD